MKISSIHVYSHTGDRRDLVFSSNGLNVITGRSSTGKSALSDIVEYCMGRSTFKVPEGVIHDRVSWYAVVYSFASGNVLVAKPRPKSGAASCSTAMIRRGEKVEIPELGELSPNSDDDGVVLLLSELLGIPENSTDVPVDQSRHSFRATIQHTTFYLFQKQLLISNKDQLFYRQNEDFQSQTIKDTFPILFGVGSADQFLLQTELRDAQRQFRINQKQLQQARRDQELSEERGLGLVAEARTVGILPSRDESSQTTIAEQLKTAAVWKPSPVIDGDDGIIETLEQEIAQLREDRQKLRRSLDATKGYAMRSTGFVSEASEQRARLESIGSLPNNENGEWQWPFAESNLGMDTPIAEALLSELRSLDQELRFVSAEKPKLAAYISEQEKRIEALSLQIRNKQEELAGAIAAEEAILEMESRNNAAARVVGRISYFLDELIPDTDIVDLENSEARLLRKIEAIEEKVSFNESSDRLSSVLNGISSAISKYISGLDAEFGQFPARFDLKNLTIVIDRPNRPVQMGRTGGGANHLAYHLAALLSIHRFAAEANIPIPRFLFLDQPTQVYFPSEASYEEVGGSVEKTEADADMEAVRRLFELLRDFVTNDAPGFQIIVTEHANLRDEWFQNALVESPWTKPPALVPEDWPEIT